MRKTTDGIVIGTDNIDECDRLVCLLSRDLGVLRAYARGARRPGSKLSGSTELLCYSRFTLFEHKGKFSIDSADSNAQFFGVRGDIDKLSLASYMCEICRETSPEHSEAPEQIRLLLNCLHMLDSGKRSHFFLKPLYELRQISLSGYMPNLVGCDRCGSFLSESFSFYPRDGIIVCQKCDLDPSSAECMPVSSSVMAAMRHIIYSDITKLFSFSLPQDSLRELSAVCERYMTTQLQRTFKSLEFYYSIVPGA